MANTIPPPPPLTSLGFQDPTWHRWFNLLRNGVASSGSTVASITFTSPMFNGGTPTNPNVSIHVASSSQSGYLTSTDWNTFNNKLSGNQTITLSGDATGSGATAIAVTLANTTVVAGTYGSSTVTPQITVDAKGRVTGVTNVATAAANWPVGNTASRPGSPSAGAVYFDTTIGQPIWYSGSNWVNAAGVTV